MQFAKGDETERRLVQSLQHEFMLCEDAFADFVTIASQMVAASHDPRRSYTAYNAYAGFLHHLYEFLLGWILAACRHSPAASAGG